jgi:hypothetical protein
VRAEGQDRRDLHDVQDGDRGAVLVGEPAGDVHRTLRVGTVGDRDEEVA